MKLNPKEFVDALKEMKIKEIMDLVEAIKEEFGIDPAAFVASQAPASDDSKAAEVKTEVTVRIVSAGQKKIEVIKAVKEIAGLGLMEAKKLVDSVPAVVKEQIKPEEAEKIREALVAAGAEVVVE